MPAPLTVERIGETARAVVFRVSAGKQGGEPVTVRVGIEGRYACLTCLSADSCEHARAARDYDRDEPAAPGSLHYLGRRQPTAG